MKNKRVLTEIRTNLTDWPMKLVWPKSVGQLISLPNFGISEANKVELARRADGLVISPAKRLGMWQERSDSIHPHLGTLDVADQSGWLMPSRECLIVPLGAGRLSLRPRVIEGSSTDWVLMPFAQDPLWKGGLLIVPLGVELRLKLATVGGVSVDALTIAHEVPRGSVNTNTTKQELKRLLLAQYSQDGLSKVAGIASLSVLALGLATAAVAGALAIGTVSTSIAAALAGIAVADPVVIGALVAEPPAREGDKAVFFLLARWPVP